MRRIAPRALLRSGFGTPPALIDGASAAERRRVRTMLEHVLPLSARIEGMHNDAEVVTALPRYPLERLRMPVLVLSAPDDGFRTLDAARDVVAQARDARLIEYANGGHLLVGRHGDAIGAIADFLRG
jgi:pimeloyl-ACP methyl ester carboxylesterase